MKKIIKLFKWFIIIIISLSIILTFTIYVSSLGNYKESDFNIPKDFFKTRFENIEGKNGFEEFIKFNKKIEKDFKENININDISKLSECVFGKRNKKYCDKITENVKDIDYIKNYLRENKVIINNILKQNDYFRFTEKYSGLNGEIINYSPLVQYFRSSRYIAYKYIDGGHQKEGLKILLNNQKIIDTLINKADFLFIGNMFLINLEKQNLNSILYFLKNYEINNDYKEKFKIILEKNIYNKLTENGLKWKKKFWDEVYRDIGSEKFKILNFFKSFNYNGPLLENGVGGPFFYLKYSFLFSEKETTILNTKVFYDLIKSKGRKGFKIKLNINNYGGREAINIQASYLISFKKEGELLKLRKEILELLK